MADIVEVRVPDIGDFKDVPVIEIPVKLGDEVKAEDSLVTLESEKATMDVPSPVAGTVTEIRVKIGDRVSTGSLVVLIDRLEATPGNGGDTAPGTAPEPAAALPVTFATSTPSSRAKRRTEGLACETEPPPSTSATRSAAVGMALREAVTSSGSPGR